MPTAAEIMPMYIVTLVLNYGLIALGISALVLAILCMRKYLKGKGPKE